MTNRFNSRLSKPLCSAAFALAAAMLPAVSHAQLNSNTSTVTLQATMTESLSISATPSNVTFNLVAGGVATGSAPVAITTTWVAKASRANVMVFGWFGTPSAALTDGATTPNNIPSSEVYGMDPTGTPTTYTAFSQSNALGTAGGGLQIFNLALTSSNRSGTRSDNLNLQINLAAQPQLPAGVYNGTLTLQAQAL